MSSTTAKAPTALRAFHIIFGVIAIAAAFIILADPKLGILTLVFILSFTLLILGVSRVTRGLSHRLYSGKHKALDVVAGIVSIILGIVVLADPVLGTGTLILLLALAAMIYGITTIVLGALVNRLPKLPRGFLMATGVFSVVFSLLVLDLPALGILTLVVLLTVSFLVNGVENIVSAL